MVWVSCLGTEVCGGVVPESARYLYETSREHGARIAVATGGSTVNRGRSLLVPDRGKSVGIATAGCETHH